MHCSQSKSTKCEIYAWNCDFLRNHLSQRPKPAVLDLACLKPKICTTQAISMCCSQSKSTKCEIFGIVMFYWNLCTDSKHKYWIWHMSNLTYAPLKPFQCICPSQNQQNVKFFVWNCNILGTTYHRDMKTCGIGFGMPQTLNTHHSSNFNALFPVKINKMWNFGCFLNSPWQKTEKNINLHREKVFTKACKSAHIGFWVCQLQCTMLQLCVTSTFWVIMVFLHLLWEGQDIGFWNMV